MDGHDRDRMSGDPDGERTDNHEYFMPEVGSDDWGKPINNNFRKLEKSSPLVVPEDEIDDKKPARQLNNYNIR